VSTDNGHAAIEVGYWLSGEEFGPRALVANAVAAEEAGFRHVMASDHFHPWLARQGHAPFVWGVLGAIAHATELHLATGVTAPIVRMHPAVVAHAAATAAVLAEGRFALGLGTGERLNEHITGAHWPRSGTRRRMLGEAIEIIRRLFAGEDLDADGQWFTVEHAQVFTRPEVPPPIWVAVSGPRTAAFAGECADGMIGLAPDSSLVQAFEHAGGQGGPRVGQLHVCWAASEDEATRTAHRLWPNAALPAALASELARPSDFDAACSLVTEDAVRRAVACGPDPRPMATAILRFAAAGYSRVYVHQIGPDQRGFLEFYASEVAPLVGSSGGHGVNATFMPS
jgi:G6PDH family F420-dependent oxidoreductase